MCWNNAKERSREGEGLCWNNAKERAHGRMEIEYYCSLPLAQSAQHVN